MTGKETEVLNHIEEGNEMEKPLTEIPKIPKQDKRRLAQTTSPKSESLNKESIKIERNQGDSTRNQNKKKEKARSKTKKRHQFDNRWKKKWKWEVRSSKGERSTRRRNQDEQRAGETNQSRNKKNTTPRQKEEKGRFGVRFGVLFGARGFFWVSPAPGDAPAPGSRWCESSRRQPWCLVSAPLQTEISNLKAGKANNRKEKAEKLRSGNSGAYSEQMHAQKPKSRSGTLELKRKTPYQKMKNPIQGITRHYGEACPCSCSLGFSLRENNSNSTETTRTQSDSLYKNRPKIERVIPRLFCLLQTKTVRLDSVAKCCSELNLTSKAILFNWLVICYKLYLQTNLCIHKNLPL